MAQHIAVQLGKRRVALYAALLTSVAFLRGESVDDDRGSESVEKALMVIAGVAAAGAVAVGLATLITATVNRF